MFESLHKRMDEILSRTGESTTCVRPKKDSEEHALLGLHLGFALTSDTLR